MCGALNSPKPWINGKRASGFASFWNRSVFLPFNGSCLYCYVMLCDVG